MLNYSKLVKKRIFLFARNVTLRNNLPILTFISLIIPNSIANFTF